MLRDEEDMLHCSAFPVFCLLNDKVGEGKKNIDLFWNSFEYR